MARRLVAGLLAGWCTVAVAACGGGGGASQGFAARADAVCIHASAALAKLGEPLTGTIAVTPAIAAQRFRALSIRAREVAELRRLRPPAPSAAAYRAFVALKARRVGARRAALHAILAHDGAGFDRNQAEYVRLLPLSYAAAARAGLTACAAKLSSSDVRAIGRLLRREETQPKAGDCRDSLTRRFVAKRYGGVAPCERALPATRSTRASVEQVRGTLPQALARVAESGGNLPTRALDVALVKLDDRWRIDDVRALSSGGLG